MPYHAGRPRLFLAALVLIGGAACGGAPETSSGFSTGGFAATSATFGSSGTDTDVGFSGSTGGEFDDGGFFTNGTTGGTGPIQYCGTPDAGAIPCSEYEADEDGGGTGYRPDGGEPDGG